MDEPPPEKATRPNPRAAFGKHLGVTMQSRPLPPTGVLDVWVGYGNGSFYWRITIEQTGGDVVVEQANGAHGSVTLAAAAAIRFAERLHLPLIASDGRRLELRDRELLGRLVGDAQREHERREHC